MCALGAAQNAPGPNGDLRKTKIRSPGEDQTNISSQNLDDDILFRSDSPTLKQFSFEGISGFYISYIFWGNILFDLKKIYYLISRKFISQHIWRKYIVWFEENKFIAKYILRKYISTCWFEENFVLQYFKYTIWFEENILFDSKKIYCRIYFEKIFCWFKENKEL